MPLSEHEQRLLEQMERALSAEDPKLDSALRGAATARRRHRTLALSVSGFVVGLVLLMAGVVFPGLVPVSILGFVVMLVCVVTAVNGWRVHGAQLFVVDPTGPAARRVGATSRQRGARPAPGRTGSTRGSDRPRGGDRPERPRRPAGAGSFMDRVEERWRRRRSDRGF